MNIAVLLAGGSGTRMGAGQPKQFIEVAGRCVLEHSIRAFHSHPNIDKIVIISHADHIDRVQEISASYHKVQHILPGGKERYDSTLAALSAYSNMTDQETDQICLLIHDAVRPMVSHRIITDCLCALQQYNAVDVAIATTDTIIEVNEQEHICRIPLRSTLRNVQTPQCFRYKTIAEAYKRGLEDPNFVTTDDCGVVHKYLPEEPIYVVRGETTNVKLTYPEDLLLAERLLKEK